LIDITFPLGHIATHTSVLGEIEPTDNFAIDADNWYLVFWIGLTREVWPVFVSTSVFWRMICGNGFDEVPVPSCNIV
jgi:hypothetical protein